MVIAAGEPIAALRNEEEPMLFSRRKMLSGLGAAGALAGFSTARSAPGMAFASISSCPFRLSVINDEISEDFDFACSVAAHDFGLSWIELRGMWKKNITELDQAELGRARGILEKYNLRVTDIA